MSNTRGPKPGRDSVRRGKSLRIRPSIAQLVVRIKAITGGSDREVVEKAITEYADRILPQENSGP